MRYIHRIVCCLAYIRISSQYIHSVPAISSSTLPKNMGMQESLTVFGCATAFAAVGAAVVVSVGLLFAPCGLAVFKVVEGVTTVTIAGRAALLIVSAAGAGVGAQIGNAVSTRSFIVRKNDRRGVVPASSGKSLSCSQSCQMAV